MAHRLEDPPLLTGQRSFLADLDREQLALDPNTDILHLAFVRSDLAHAVIRSIDTTEALAQPGVVAVETAETLNLPTFRLFADLPAAMNRGPLARERVRSVGEPVAVVIATSVEAAADAIDLVQLDLDPLPVIVDAVDNASEAILYPEAGSNVVSTFDQIEDVRPGELADASASPTTIELSVVNQRVGSVPLECDGIIAIPTPDGLDIWCTSQGVQGIRSQLAEQLDVPPEVLRVRSPAVGGGFGGRATIIPEFVVAAALASRLGRTVRWLQSRYENFTTQAQGRDYVTDVTLALSDDGRIQRLDCDVVANAGAEAHLSALLLVAAQRQAAGLYRVPHLTWAGTTLVTNTTPVGAYRGAGQPEANHARERVLDVAARRLGIDPIELRRRNMPTAADFPFTSAGGVTYAEGDPISAMDQAIELADVAEWRAEQAKRRQQGDLVELGIGLANYAQTSGRGTPTDSVVVQVREDGTVLVGCASPSHGQGHLTTWSQLVADELGIDVALVEMVDSDTDVVATGQTTGGSRSTQVAASALVSSCHDIIEAARPEVAARLEAAVDDLVVAPAGFGLGAGLAVAGVPTSRVTWAELAAESTNHCLDAARNESVPGESHPYGTHVSVVEVDTETGRVELLHHTAVDDCGRVLQPVLVEGQQHGGSVAGIAQALYEHFCYDELGNPLAATLGSYLLPAASELCDIATASVGIETERNQLGTRGIGENGCNGATGAVHNAVMDALSEHGVEHIDLPLSPERVWSAINQ